MPIHQRLHPDDLALVARIVDGDDDAAQEFSQVYAKRFEYLAHRKGIPYQECPDVAQNALMDAFSQMKRGLYRGESKLATWLSKIIHGKVVEYHRHRPVVVLESLDSSDSEKDLAEKQVLYPVDYEMEVITRETVWEILMRLPSHHRAVLVLKHLERYTLDEIRRMCDLTLAQVSGRLYSAEEAFRRLLSEEEPTTKKISHQALLHPPSQNEGGTHARSISDQAQTGLSRARDQQVADGLLLWASQRIGEATGRGALVGMRFLLARGSAAGCGGAGLGFGSQPAANAHVC